MKFFQKEVFKPEISISPFLPEDSKMFKNLFNNIESEIASEEQDVTLLVNKSEELEKDGAYSS